MTAPGTLFGSKYESTKHLPVVQIAALIRADVKAAQKSGNLPSDLKLSIRTRHHNCIDVVIVSCPSIPRWLNPERLEHEFSNGERGYDGGVWMSDEAADLISALREIQDAYNYDRSDTQSDYFDVRFYGTPSISSDLTSPEKAQARTAYEASLNPVMPAAEHDAHGSAILSLVERGG